MKKSHYALMLFAIVGLLAFFLWLFRLPPTVIRHVSLAFVTNSVAPGTVNFRLKNDGPLAIFASELFVEIQTPGGWQTCQHLTPDDSRVIAAGGFKDVAIPVSGVSGAWRLRATYGEEMRGPALFFLKVEVGIQQRRIPGAGFGGFSGSYSVIGPEMKTPL